MSERNRLLLLIAIMATISFIVGGIAVIILYLTAIEQEKARLAETAQSQARLIEAVARQNLAHNQEYHPTFPQSAEAISLSQVADAHEHYQGFGETGEFVLAKQAGGNIVYLLRHRHSNLDFPQPVPLEGTLDTPMQKALLGQSGIMVGLDYRGVKVLAAYEPVDVLNFGIVAKIDLKEVREPFIQAALQGMILASILIIFGAWLFFRITSPIIRLLEGHKEHLERQVEQRTTELVSSNIQLEKEIIERKQAEEKFRGILESVPDAVVIVGPQGVINLVNKQAEQFFGYSRKELIGQPIEVLLPQKYHDSHIKHRNNYSDRPTVRPMGSDMELFALHKNGHEIPVEISLGPIRTGNEFFVASTIRDTTLHREAEKALQEAKDASESANRAKTQFLTNMSHEIRTPLNAIVGFSQILLQRGQTLELPRDFNEYLNNIKLSGQSLSELINNILDLAKIEAGKMTLSRGSLNLPLLIQGIYHINKAHALEKKLQFSYDIDPQLPVTIDSDRTKLNQILMNLISNAIKFTPEHKKVWIHARKEETFLVLEVGDEGIGIAKDHQNTIFDAFEQIDASVTRYYSGTGLGLTISKKMVEILEGDIWVESVSATDETPGGSTFFVKIPLIESHTQDPTSQQPEWRHLHFSKDNQIVVVEDNPMNQKMMEALFLDLGITIHLEGNGLAGIEKVLALIAEGHPPDLIFMDIYMPGMDGLQATREIRKHADCKEIPIVALSAEAFDIQQEKAFQSGINEYLTKPLEIEKLVPVLQKYLKSEPGSLDLGSRQQKHTLESLPPELKKQILDEFKTLSQIPHFLSHEVVEQTKKILDLCQDYDTSYSTVLQQIESAVFSRNSKQIPELIEEVLHGQHPDR